MWVISHDLLWSVMKPDCHPVRHELVENIFPVSPPHYSKMQCPFTKPNLTDFFESSTHGRWKLAKERLSGKVWCLKPAPWSSWCQSWWRIAKWPAILPEKPDPKNQLKLLPKQQECDCAQEMNPKSSTEDSGPRVNHMLCRPTWNSCLSPLRLNPVVQMTSWA